MAATPLQPVPAGLQREALDTLARQVLAADAVRVSPALLRRLAPNFEERGEGQDISTDYPVGEVVTSIQRALLGQLMSDGLAARILDSEAKAEPSRAGQRPDAFRLSELYGRLARELWSELDRPQGDIDMTRRELQREHVNRIASQLMRPSAGSRADARALLRSQARALLPRLNAAAHRAALSEEARAHLQEAANTLGLALAAPLVRMGV
ncbi:MAG: zinc-dependent metalloprotease [Ideonella sp.]|nr:zinc-dependent metalloprotease [Ideonella sp.]